MIRHRSEARIVERYDPSRGRTFYEVRYFTTETYGSDETHPLHLPPEVHPYVFPGIWPFIERAQSALGCDLHQFGRAKNLWHVTQMQNALGQMAKLDDKSRRECLDHINKNRMSLACALLGVDNAILDCCLALGLDLPDYLKGPEDGPVQSCDASDQHLDDDLGSVQDGGVEAHPGQPRRAKHGQGKPDRAGDGGG